MHHNLLIDYLFVVSVILIWFTLGYQLFLFLLGFQYSRQSAKEKLVLGGRDLTLPSVSVLIPARNEGLVIQKTLQSILELDYPPDRLEVIVINDGSTDNTEAVVQELATLDSRVHLISIPVEEGGRGKSAALNIALRQASHPVIGVYDADNRPEPQALRYMAEQLMSDAKLGAVIGKFRAINKADNLLLRFLNIEALSFQWIVQAGRWMLLKMCTLPCTNFLVHKSILRQLKGWDEKAMTEDAELTIRLCEAGYQIKFI